MDIRKYTALDIGNKIRNKEISSPEVTKEYLKAIRELDKDINSYISVDEKSAIRDAEAVQERIDEGEFISPLAGVPLAVKDNICIEDGTTTSASKMLENFKPPYNATVIDKMKEYGAVILGKTNLDEFAMGGSTETSYFGVTKNPWDHNRVPGGSSGGSASAVAAELAPYALGSDTGGSIRQPCSFTNLTGIKPTYGSVSRFGLMAYASSLDQIGPMARSARDCAVSLSMISGIDLKDSTSVMEDQFDFCKQIESSDTTKDLKGMKIGIPANYFEKGLSDDVKDKVLKAASEFKSLGAETEEFEIPLIDYAVPAYYIIACAEASSNLSRYDGVKYGFRSENAKDILEIYYKSRSEGFGTEVKRRIMLGSFVLSSGYFDAYYKKALKVRALVKKAFTDAFSKYDMILSPVSPTVSYKIGEQISDPLSMYMADIYTISINLAGLPSIALPCGIGEEGMPVGMQLIGDSFTEDKLFTAAFAYQDNTDHHLKRPETIGGGLFNRDRRDLRGGSETITQDQSKKGGER